MISASPSPLRILELISSCIDHGIKSAIQSFSPGRDDSSMPVTTVTGHVSLIDSRVPARRQQLSRGSLSSLPGLWDHQRPYAVGYRRRHRAAVPAGTELHRSLFTAVFPAKKFLTALGKGDIRKTIDSLNPCHSSVPKARPRATIYFVVRCDNQEGRTASIHPEASPNMAMRNSRSQRSQPRNAGSV